MRNDQGDFIGSGSMDISKHFNMMESMDLMDPQAVHRMPFYKNE